MKKWLLIIWFWTFYAGAEEIKNIFYISPWNYGMPALEVLNGDDGFIKIVIQSAVLGYPDSGYNFGQMDELAKIFNVERLNSIIVKIPKDMCKARKTNSILRGQILSCNSLIHNKKISLVGAKTNFAGDILQESDIVLDALVRVEIIFQTIVSGFGEKKFFQAQFTGNVPAQIGINKWISFNLVKSGIFTEI